MRTCICSPCGILGYGFPKNSFERAMAEKPDAIVVDAGSTDAGPHKLGAGVAIVSRMAAKKDLALLMQGARDLNIPLIIGSAGGSGALLTRSSVSGRTFPSSFKTLETVATETPASLATSRIVAIPFLPFVM